MFRSLTGRLRERFREEKAVSQEQYLTAEHAVVNSQLLVNRAGTGKGSAAEARQHRRDLSAAVKYLDKLRRDLVEHPPEDNLEMVPQSFEVKRQQVKAALMIMYNFCRQPRFGPDQLAELERNWQTVSDFLPSQDDRTMQMRDHIYAALQGLRSTMSQPRDQDKYFRTFQRYFYELKSELDSIL